MKSDSHNEPEEIIYFGDGPWDYLTAQKLGITFMGIDVNQIGKLEELGASYVYRDFQDTGQIIDQINSRLR